MRQDELSAGFKTPRKPGGSVSLPLQKLLQVSRAQIIEFVLRRRERLAVSEKVEDCHWTQLPHTFPSSQTDPGTPRERTTESRAPSPGESLQDPRPQRRKEKRRTIGGNPY